MIHIWKHGLISSKLYRINNDRTGLLGKIYFTVIETRAKISNRLWVKVIKSYVLKKNHIKQNTF